MSHSGICYWKYGDLEHTRNTADPQATIWRDHSPCMVPVGVGVTDHDGFLLQSVPFDGVNAVAHFHGDNHGLIVRRTVPAATLAAMQNRLAQKDKDNPAASFAPYPDPHTCPWAPGGQSRPKDPDLSLTFVSGDCTTSPTSPDWNGKETKTSPNSKSLKI